MTERVEKGAPVKRQSDGTTTLAPPEKGRAAGLVIGLMELQALCYASTLPRTDAKKMGTDCTARVICKRTVEQLGPDLYLQGGGVRFRPEPDCCRFASTLLHHTFPAVVQFMVDSAR